MNLTLLPENWHQLPPEPWCDSALTVVAVVIVHEASPPARTPISS